MLETLRHTVSKATLTLCIALALCAGATACAWLTGCGGDSGEKPAKPAEPATASSTGQTESGTKAETEGAGKADTTPDTASKSKTNSNSDANSNANSGTTSDGASKKSAKLTCTFLDVGQGDCAILESNGHYMIIDGGNPQASSKVYAYLSKQNISHFDYLIATHDDADHVGGLAAAARAASVGTAYCSVTSSEKDAFQDMTRYLSAQDVQLKRPKVGKTFKLGKAKVKVIAPARTDTKDNDDSLVLRVTYGKTSILFTGDASEIEEDEMLQRSSRLFSTTKLKSTLLKVAHHGSATSSSARFLRAVSPEIAVISVGKDNTYGHPTSEALTRLSDCGASIFRTDLQGTITATSDGKTFTMKTQKQAKTPTDVSQSDQKAAATKGDDETEYIGNVNSLKFHRPSCRSLPLEKNRRYFKSRAEATDAGYSSCGICQP